LKHLTKQSKNSLNYAQLDQNINISAFDTFPSIATMNDNPIKLKINTSLKAIGNICVSLSTPIKNPTHRQQLTLPDDGRAQSCLNATS
jgi:hypothetical protein